MTSLPKNKPADLNGFVTRIVHSKSNPVVVEYQLTEYAGTLTDILHALADWYHAQK
jgi:DNA-binding HxlR family transcriptional regulator